MTVHFKFRHWNERYLVKMSRMDFHFRLLTERPLLTDAILVKYATLSISVVKSLALLLANIAHLLCTHF